MNESEARGVLVRIIGGIAPEVDLAGVPDDAELQQELDLDSMDFLNLVNGILEATGIDVPERDYPLLQSPAGCIGYLVAHSGDAPRGGLA